MRASGVGRLARRVAALPASSSRRGAPPFAPTAPRTPSSSVPPSASSSPVRRPPNEPLVPPLVPDLGRRGSRAFGHAPDAYTAAHRARAVALAAPLGFAAGAFGSLVGVGGGVLIVPALTGAVPIPQRVVTGTSLVAVLATAAVSAANFTAAGCVDHNAALILGATAMLSAPIGARLTSRMDCEQLRRVLAWFLLLAAPAAPAKHLYFASSRRRDASASATSESSAPSKSKSKAHSGAADPHDTHSADTHSSAPVLIGVGAVAGLASGLLGIGGGTVVTPLLATLTPLPQAAVLGTSLLAMLPPSAVALWQHNRMGNVDARLGAALAIGTAIGGGIGSRVAADEELLPRGALEAAFCVGMAFLSRRTFAGLKKTK